MGMRYQIECNNRNCRRRAWIDGIEEADTNSFEANLDSADDDELCEHILDQGDFTVVDSEPDGLDD